MNWKWRYEVIRDWTVFLWNRFPAIFTAEIEYRIWTLVGYRRIYNWWTAERMATRLSNIGDSFALYMTVKRENELRKANPDCWGGETFDNESD